MTRIVYGAACTWWDVKSKAAVSPSSMALVCPHCGGPVGEEEEAVWLSAALAHSASAPGYLAFLLQVQGAVCMPHAQMGAQERVIVAAGRTALRITV